VLIFALSFAGFPSSLFPSPSPIPIPSTTPVPSASGGSARLGVYLRWAQAAGSRFSGPHRNSLS
jgi:hypothetical protein